MTEDIQPILKELSDIKASLAVNTSETSNIKSSVSEIKGDVKEIKNDFVSRRELTDSLTTIRDEISPLKKTVYGGISAFLLAVIGAIVKFFIHK